MLSLGLALGGGGARGLAHVGALKVFEREGIPIAAVSGTSMGAIIGGMYAYFGDAKTLEEFVIENAASDRMSKYGLDALAEAGDENLKPSLGAFWDFIKVRVHIVRSLNKMSFFSWDIFEEMFSIFPDVPVESLKIPFSAVATDLLSGEEINFTKGSLRKAIMASSAVPGIFPPVKIENRLLVDGSVSDNIPIAQVKNFGVQRTIAIDVSKCVNEIQPPENIIELLFRTVDISSFRLSQTILKSADLVVRPQVRHLTWISFKKYREIISEGEKAAETSLDEVKKLIDKSAYIEELEKYIEFLKNKAEKTFTAGIVKQK